MAVTVYVSKSVVVGKAVNVASPRIPTPRSHCLKLAPLSDAFAAPSDSRSRFPTSPCCKSVPMNICPTRLPMAVGPDFVGRMSRREHLKGFCGRAENVIVVPTGAPPPVVLPHVPPKVSGLSGMGTWPSPSGGEPGAIIGRHGGECTAGGGGGGTASGFMGGAC